MLTRHSAQQNTTISITNRSDQLNSPHPTLKISNNIFHVGATYTTVYIGMLNGD